MTRPRTFEEIATELGALVAEKNASYGDAYQRLGDVLRLLYPSGITPAQMTDLPMLLRTLEKLFRVASRKDAYGENPWFDIAGVALNGIRVGEKAIAERDGEA